MDKQTVSIPGAGWCVFALIMVFAPLAGYGATESSSSSAKTSSASKTSVTNPLAKFAKALVGKQGVRTLPSGEQVNSVPDTQPETAAAKPEQEAKKTESIPETEAVTTNVTFEPATAKKQRTGSASTKQTTGKTSLDSQQVPAQSGAAVKKYVFQYPEQPVITEDMQPVKRTITGEVGFVIKAGMNVEFDRKASSASDLWIEFTKGTKVEGVKALSDFQPGDQVQVVYEESKDHAQRAVQSVKLLKRKTDEEKKREAEEEARAGAASTKTTVQTEAS